MVAAKDLAHFFERQVILLPKKSFLTTKCHYRLTTQAYPLYLTLHTIKQIIIIITILIYYYLYSALTTSFRAAIESSSRRHWLEFCEHGLITTLPRCTVVSLRSKIFDCSSGSQHYLFCCPNKILIKTTGALHCERRSFVRL